MQHPMPPRDWDTIAADPEFRALMTARRRFVIPASIFFALFFLALPASLALAPGVMARAAIGPLTLAYAFAFAQFVTSWVLLALYMRAARGFDVRARRIAERVQTEAVS